MRRRHLTGFNLLELMIIVALIAILATLATPSFVNFIQNNRALAMSNQLATALNTARVNALSTGNQYSVCPIQDSTASSCGNQSAWSNGWAVFSDPTAQYILTSNNVVQVSDYTGTTGVTVTLNPTNVTTVGYNALGVLVTTPFTLTIQPNTCTGNQVQMISVTSSGRVSTQTVAC